MKPPRAGRSATNLENIRRGQFEGLREEVATNPERAPDIGEPRLHPTAGATVVGARKFLIAYNINLNTPDVEIAKRIAKAIRFSSGGFRYVKAMGVPLASRNLAQVSMNLTDFEQTPIHRVFETVRTEAERYGVAMVGSEIVGLIPKKALEMAAEYFLRCENFRPEMVLENRLADAVAERRAERVSGRAGGCDCDAGRGQRRGGRRRDGGGAGRDGLGSREARRTGVRGRPAVSRGGGGARRRGVQRGDGRVPDAEGRAGAAMWRRRFTRPRRCRWKWPSACSNWTRGSRTCSAKRPRGSPPTWKRPARWRARRTGALANVRINLESIKDETFRRALEERVGAITK